MPKGLQSMRCTYCAMYAVAGILELEPARTVASAASPYQCARTASSSSATMLVILIIGLTAGPAVSL